MKKQILIAFAGTALLFSCKPNPWEVTREISIDAPATVVFEQVNNHKNRDSWSPWEAMDPNMKKSYEGPESGVGAIYKWVGNDSVGTGSMEILESNPSSYIKSKLAFTSPWESESTVEWNFAENNGVTQATWTVKGELPGFMFWMGQEEMEESMGPDFERGLESLKIVAEGMAKPKFEMAFTQVASSPYFFIRDKVSFQGANSEFYGSRFGKIGAYLGKDMATMTSPPFAIFHEWNEETEMADISIAMANTSAKPGSKEIQKGNTYEGEAAMVSYQGPYEGTGEVHYFMHEAIQKAGYEMAGSPWEVYVTDPGAEPDTSLWITQVYYPVVKK